jgi:hypothetical protein
MVRAGVPVAFAGGAEPDEASRSPRRTAVVLGPLGAVLVVLYPWSQHRPGVLLPPLAEWAIASGLVCAAVVAVAVAVDRVQSAPTDRRDVRRLAWPPTSSVRAGAAGAARGH